MVFVPYYREVSLIMIDKDNKQQFSEIYDKYIESIYRFVFIKTNSQFIAEDITSEIFTRYWQSLQKNNEILNERAFLYKTARNAVIDYYRKKGRTPNLVSTELSDEIPDNDNIIKTVELSHEIGTIQKAISQLKDEYQNVVIWHYLDDLPISEIAKTIGKSEPAVRMLLSRALKEVKERIKEV